jgi:hypothetical protein
MLFIDDARILLEVNGKEIDDALQPRLQWKAHSGIKPRGLGTKSATGDEEREKAGLPKKLKSV